MSIRVKITGAVTLTLFFLALSLSLIWYRDSSNLLDSYTQTRAMELMRNAYNAFGLLLTETEYLSALIITNRENIIIPLEIINAESRLGLDQFTYRQLAAKRRIDSYIGSMYGHKYYITGISVVSSSGHIFKTGASLYYPEELFALIQENGAEIVRKHIVLFSPVRLEGQAALAKTSFVIPAVRSIENLDGGVAGYAALYFDYAVINDIFSDNLPADSRFEVRDRNQNMIFSNLAGAQYDFDNAGRGYVTSHYIAENAGWVFNMAIPTGVLQANIQNTFRVTMLVFALVAVLAAALCALILYRITNNIKLLNDAMAEVGGGNLEARAAISGHDETARMGEVFNTMVLRVKALLEEIKTGEEKKRQAEIDFLQAQINPHFIANTLNTVVWMATMTGANNIVNLTRSLIDLLQSSTRRGGDFVTIAEELNHVKSYLNIQTLCGARDFSFRCNAENDVEKLLTPRCILQPVVENALIHGLDNREGENEIAVSVYRKDAVVYMEVFDNGNGMTEEKTSALLTREGYGDRRYSSIGLRNIDERIKLCFGGEYGVSFDSKVNQYTRVILRIPVTTRSGGEEEEVDNDGA